MTDPALPSLPPIETGHLRLRPLGRADASAFRDMTDEPAIMTAIHFLSRPFECADAERLIVGEGDGRDCFWGAWWREHPALIGTVGTHLRGDDEIEIGYWFATAMRGRGLASEAVTALVTMLAPVYPARRIVAECRPENLASWRLLERVGFRPTGADGLRSGRKTLVLATPAQTSAF